MTFWRDAPTSEHYERDSGLAEAYRLQNDLTTRIDALTKAQSDTIGQNGQRLLDDLSDQIDGLQEQQATNYEEQAWRLLDSVSQMAPPTPPPSMGFPGPTALPRPTEAPGPVGLPSPMEPPGPVALPRPAYVPPEPEPEPERDTIRGTALSPPPTAAPVPEGVPLGEPSPPEPLRGLGLLGQGALKGYVGAVEQSQAATRAMMGYGPAGADLPQQALAGVQTAAGPFTVLPEVAEGAVRELGASEPTAQIVNAITGLVGLGGLTGPGGMIGQWQRAGRVGRAGMLGVGAVGAAGMGTAAALQSGGDPLAATAGAIQGAGLAGVGDLADLAAPLFRRLGTAQRVGIAADTDLARQAVAPGVGTPGAAADLSTGIAAGVATAAEADKQAQERGYNPFQRGAIGAGAMVAGMMAGPAAGKLIRQLQRNPEALGIVPEGGHPAARRLSQAAETIRAKQAARLSDEAEQLRASLEQRYARWDELQEQLAVKQADVDMLSMSTEDIGGLERPWFTRAAGRYRSWTDQEIVEFANRHGYNPYESMWDQGVDPENIRLFRREVIARKTGGVQTGLTPAQEKERLRQARAVVRQLTRDNDLLEKQIERDMIRASALETRAEAFGQPAAPSPVAAAVAAAPPPAAAPAAVPTPAPAAGAAVAAAAPPPAAAPAAGVGQPPVPPGPPAPPAAPVPAPGPGSGARVPGAVAGPRGLQARLTAARAATETPEEADLRNQDMLAAGRVATGPQTAIERAINSLPNRARRQLFASERPVHVAQSMVYKALNRPPTVQENAELATRLFAGRLAAAGQRITDELEPAIKALPQRFHGALERYMIGANNADIDASIQRRVTGQALSRPVRPPAPRYQRAVDQAQQVRDTAQATLDDLQDRLKQVLAGGRDRKAQQSLQAQVNVAGRRLLTADRRLTDAQARLAAAMTAAEQRHIQTAQLRGEVAGAERLYPGGVHAHPLNEVQRVFRDQYGDAVAEQIFESADRIWKGYVSNIRRDMFNVGLIDKETFDVWERDFSHYVPTRLYDYMPENGPVNVAPGSPVLTIKDLMLKQLTTRGTERAREAPLASLARLAISVQNQVQRQKGARAFLSMVENSPALKRVVLPQISAREAAKRGLAAGEFVPLTHRLTVDEATFSVFKNGFAETYVIPKALEPVIRLDPASASGMGGTIGNVLATVLGAPLARAVHTSLSPFFLAVGPLVDSLQFLARQGIHRPTNYAALARGFWDSVARGGGPDWAEAVRHGAGQASAFHGLSPEQLRARILKEGALGGMIRPVRTFDDFMGAAGDVLALPFEPIREFGQALERSPRLAAYRLAIQAGLSKDEAALAARDITVDFQRGGALVMALNRFIPFLNVGFQGPERYITYDWRKGNRTNAAVSATVFTLGMLGLEAWNRLMYPEDYADVPDYVKDTGLVFVTPVQLPPFPDGRRRGHLTLWMPLPHDYRFIRALQIEAVSRKAGDTPRTWWRMLASLGNVISPTGTDLLPVPPVIRQYAEQMGNVEWQRGRAIVPQRFENLPPGEQYEPATESAIGRAIGQRIGVSPRRIDYATREMLGGPGRIALEASNIVARAAGAPAPVRDITGTPTDIPVLGGLLGRYVRPTAGGETLRRQRDILQEQQNQMTTDLLRQIAQGEAYQRASPEIKQRIRLQAATRVALHFDKLRRVAAAQREVTLGAAGAPGPAPAAGR